MRVTAATSEWLVDVHGRVLQHAGAESALPTLADPVAEDLEPGDRVSSRAVRAALKAFGSMSVGLRSRVRTAIATGEREISFELAGEVLVNYGAAERVRDKNEVLAALIERVEAGERDVSYIDVRVPSSPAIAPHPPGVTEAPDDGAG